MRSLLWIFLIGTLGANSSACGLLGKSEVKAIVKIGAPATALDSQVDVDRVANLVPQDESIANSVSSVSLTVAGSCITDAVAVSIIVETANIDITVPCDASSGMFETVLNLLDAPDGKTSIRIKFLNSLVSTASMYEIERVVIKDTEGLESFSIPETFTESAGYIRLTEVSGAAIYRVTFTPLDPLGGPPTTIESTSTNIPVSALTFGTSYTVSIEALDDKENATSASNTGTFINVSAGPPGAFSISSATNGHTQSVVTWGAASGATSYTVKYGTSSGSYGTTVSTSATSPTIITGLSNGTTYYIMVTAVNASGSTNASAQVTATPAPTPTSVAPSNFVVTTTSTNLCQDDDCWIRNHTFSWTAPSGSNSTLLHYEVSTPVAVGNWFIRFNYQSYIYEYNLSPEDHLMLRVYPPSQTTHFNSAMTSTSSFRLRAVYGYRTTDPDCDGLCLEVPTGYSDSVEPTSPSGSSLFIDTTPAAIKIFGGLMWSNKRPNATLQGAKDHCNALSYGGVTGWRLPTVDEMTAVYANGIYGTASADWMTTSQMNDYFWAPLPSNTYGYAYLTNLANGVNTNLFELIPNAVVCVKTQPPT